MATMAQVGNVCASHRGFRSRTHRFLHRTLRLLQHPSDASDPQAPVIRLPMNDIAHSQQDSAVLKGVDTPRERKPRTTVQIELTGGPRAVLHSHVDPIVTAIVEHTEVQTVIPAFFAGLIR